MKNRAAIFLLVVMILQLGLGPASAEAQDDTVPLIFRDTVVGAGIGAFIGGLVMLTTNNESEHWDYMAYGALAGALSGLAYGIRYAPHAVVEIEKGAVTVGLPAVKSRPSGAAVKPERPAYYADLLKVSF